jgi:energy-coupling factor transport system substrate-specific component
MPVSTTRTLVLVPVAIALNIALGSTVQQVLKLPIYLDSVGTVIVGVLAGPLAGMATGALTNLIWAYVLPPPLAAPTAGPFAITAAVIGLLAGLWGRLGLFRSRRASEAPVLLGAVGVAVAVAILIAYTFTRAYASPGTFKSVTGAGPEAFGPSEVAFGIVVAVVSAPISAYVFGGVTGFGGDVVVAAFRAAGANLYQATLEQGLLSDPLDKMITCLLVFLVLAGMPRRVVARFPNGERLVETD